MAPSDEVNAAVGAAPDLAAQIATLESELATPTVRDVKAATLADLKQRKAVADAVELQGEAEKRLLGVSRALGSLSAQSTLDNARLLEAARKFADQVEALNERYEKCLALRHEAAALAEVFALPMPTLAPVTVPALRHDVQAAFETTSRVGVRDNGFVQPATDNDGRRNYEELGSVPGREIIRRKLA